MKRPALSLTFALAVVAASLTVFHLSAPAASSDTDQILASERAWAKAPVDGNADAMASYMADDYIEISSESKQAGKTTWTIITKSDWVAAVRSKREKYTSVDLRNLKVYLHGSVATVTGEYSQTGTEDGKDISASGFYVNTWVKQNGKWQAVSSVFP